MIMKYLIGKLGNRETPVINHERCLLQYGKQERCSLCRAECPTGAMIPKAKGLAVKEDLCRSCGICKARCPSGAIFFNEEREKKGLYNLKKNQTIVFSCDRDAKEGSITFPCLNGLTQEYLGLVLLFSKNRNVYFNLTGCSRCSIKSGCEVFLGNLDRGETLLQDLGISRKVHLVYRQEDMPRCKSETMTRKEMFLMMKKESLNITMNAGSEILGGNKENDFSARDLLIKLVKENNGQNSEAREEQKEGQSKIFKNWTVDSRCRGCGRCEAVCPWKAWSIRQGEEMVIKHDSEICRGCGLCQEECPYNSIKERAFYPEGFKASDVKVRIPLVKCGRCKGKFAQEKKDQGLCSLCEKRERLRRSIL